MDAPMAPAWLPTVSSDGLRWADELDILRHVPFNAETPHAALSADVTPTEDHFIRASFGPPEVLPQFVTVGGAVARSLELSLAELRAMPSVTTSVTLECAGNGRLDMHPLPVGEPWRGRAVGTASYTGVPLHTVMAMAGLDLDVVEIVFQGADRGVRDGDLTPFRRALPVVEAVRESTLLAWAMNGQPLSREHGAPMRLVVAGWYGMASVKWLEQIEAVRTPYDGPFQTASYVYESSDGAREPVRRMRPRSILIEPRPEAVVGDGLPLTMRGWAWSGLAIESVEVCVDDGPWQFAALDVQRDPGAWRGWSFLWRPSRTGRHVVATRATDNAGACQPDVAAWNRLGYGNNAITRTIVNVR